MWLNHFFHRVRRNNFLLTCPQEFVRSKGSHISTIISPSRARTMTRIPVSIFIMQFKSEPRLAKSTNPIYSHCFKCCFDGLIWCWRVSNWLEKIVAKAPERFKTMHLNSRILHIYWKPFYHVASWRTFWLRRDFWLSLCSDSHRKIDLHESINNQ